MKNLALMVIAVAVGTGISTDIPPKDEGQLNGYFHDGDDAYFYCILMIDGELTGKRFHDETICEIITRATHVFDVVIHYEDGTQKKYDHCRRMTFPEFVSTVFPMVDSYWYKHCLILTPEDDHFEKKKEGFFLARYRYLVLVPVILVTVLGFRGILY